MTFLPTNLAYSKKIFCRLKKNKKHSKTLKKRCHQEMWDRIVRIEFCFYSLANIQPAFKNFSGNSDQPAGLAG